MIDINETLQNLRVNYQMAKLDVGDCDLDPEKQFDRWLEDALRAHCDEPNAFVLSTVREGQPRGRVVLLKAMRDGQFIFYTNYQSAKGREVSLHEKVSLTFLWLPLQRQVRIEGLITKVSPQLSEAYFHRRPRGSQLGALASPQSRKLENRSELEALFKDVERLYEGVELLPRPAHWGGYGIIPHYYEFWQGRDNRMHDRICYEKNQDGWRPSRLAP